MKSRWFSILLIIGLLALFAACNRSEDDAENNEAPATDDDAADDDAQDDDSGDDDAIDDDQIDDDIAPPEYPETCPEGPTFTFDLASEPMVVPFPNDLYTVTDTSSPTGMRVHIDEKTTRPLGALAANNLLGFFTDAYNELNGFSPLSDLYLPVGVEPDAASLPDEIDLAFTDSVLLMVDDPQSAHDGELAPLLIEWRAPDLHLTPWFPLKEKTHYVLVATRNLATADDCYRASNSMRALWTAWATQDQSATGERYVSMLNRLAEKGVAPDQVLSLADFTTGWVTHDLVQAKVALDELAEDTPPVFYDWDIMLDQDPRLYATAHASFDVPIFKPEGEAWTFDEQGDPIVDHIESVRAYFTIPAEDANPDGQPYPIVIFEHGMFNDKHEMRPPFTTEIAAQGFAMVAIDAICHGDRLPPGTGEIGQFLCFYDIFHPSALRDNFRESVANLLWLRLALQSLSDVDLDENGTPDFDVTRIYSLGMSFGSIWGGAFTALDPEIEAHALAAAGAKLSSIARDGEAGPYFDLVEMLENILAPDEPLTDFLHLILFGMFQAILDPADSANYLAHTMNDPLPIMGGYVPQVFQQGSAYDETIGGLPGGWLCRAAGWSQVMPIVWDAGVDRVVAPYSDSGYYQYDTDEHTLIFDDDPMGQASRMQVIHYFKTHLDNGSGEIVDPYAIEIDR